MSTEQNLQEASESTDWKTEAIDEMKKWNVRYYLWKAFDKSQLDLIKAYVGLVLFANPEGDENSNFEIDFQTMYYKYDEKQRNIIDRICNQFQFDSNQLCLSNTILYLNLSKPGYQSCVFRQMRSSGDVQFIDLNGRAYTSWEHFVETNKLPKCEYMAPKGGIHNLVEEVEVHKSPASSKLGSMCDFIACGASIMAVGFYSVAPVVALSLGVGSTVYTTGQSFHTLSDRIEHRQSIAPSNFESISCYANIGTSAICGAASLALAKSARIIELSGKYSNVATVAIKGVNYTAVASTFTSVGIHLFNIQQKYRSDTLEWSDLVNVCLDIFLMYGAISNVRQMRAYFSNLKVNPTSPKGLSKGARRRWRKRQAKLNGSGALLGDENVTKVGEWDPEVLKFMLAASSTMCSTAISEYCPSLYQIYKNVRSIINDIHDFYLRKIDLERFCDNIFFHGRNLYKLLKNNSREIKETIMRYLQRFGIEAPPEWIAEICNIVDDGVITINNINEEISIRTDSTYEYENEQIPANCIIYEVILDTIRHRIRRGKINTSEDLFLVFAQELSLVTKEIKSQVVQEYEEMLSNNIRMMGETKAKIVLSQIGINSKNDFARKITSQIIKKLKCEDPVDISITFENQLDELFSVYRDLFLMITNADDNSSIQVLEICEILSNSIELIIQPLLEFFKKAKELYEMNQKYFGHKEAMIFVVSALDLNLEDVLSNNENYKEILFISIAKKKLNLCEIVFQLLPIKELTIQSINKSVQFTDDFKMEALLSVCNFYVQKIGSNEMTKVYSFITDKFIDHFRSLANQQTTSIADVTEKLEFNVNILGKSNFNMMCKFLCETERFEIFKQVVETFKKEDFVTGLITEYDAKMYKNANFYAEYFKHIFSDDGATIYTINVESRYDIDELKHLAVKLFSLNINLIHVVQKAENLVILKQAVKYVAFQFIKDESESLIIQVDLSKVSEKIE